jgi:hypothetical protein
VALLNRSFSNIFYGIVILGVIGMVSRLFADPIGVLRNLLIFTAVAGIIFFAFKRLTKNQPGKRDQRAYVKAAKESKKRFKQRNQSKASGDKVASFSAAQNVKKSKNRKKSDIHLKVIEGKKGKKKNRA